MSTLLVLVSALLVVLTNKERVKFKVSSYLEKLSDDEKNELKPYICGVFILGLVYPILVYLGSIGIEILL